MSNKFKRYGIPVRVENTPLFKEALENPDIETLTLGGTEVSGILTKDDIVDKARDIYDDMLEGNPPQFDAYIPTVAAMAYYVNENPCLIEGTEITLADKSRKKIEEIKAGDFVLGYNPKTGKTCETVVISAYCTGVSTQFKCRQFSDGNRLLIFGKHKYYNPKTKHAAELPSEPGFTALNENLEEVTCIGNRFYSTYGMKTRRWNIITSNNTYFADGILCAFGAQDKYSYFLNRGQHKKLPENIKEILLADCETANDIYSVSADKEYLAAVAGKIDARHKAYNATIAAKIEAKKLSGDKAKNAQQIVEEKRAEYKRLDTEIAAIRKQYVKETPTSAFEKCCERDNAALETFKAWLIPSYETPIKKGKKK